MRFYVADGWERKGPPHDFLIQTVDDRLWARAQYEEGRDYDTESYENYLKGHKIILQDQFNIDVDKIESKISKNTKAILPVHLYGQPSEIGKIKDILQIN